jgi:hypothetical protein
VSAADVATNGDAAKPVEKRPIDVTTRLAFRPSEAATAIGLSEDFFREHVQHELRWIRRGRVKLVARAEIEAWLASEAERVLPEEPTQ